MHALDLFTINSIIEYNKYMAALLKIDNKYIFEYQNNFLGKY